MKKQKNKVKKSVIRRRNRMGYVFTLPFIIGVVVFFIPEMFNLFRFSMSEITVLPSGQGYELEFVGLQYYIKALLEDAKFNRMLLGLLGKVLAQTPIILIFSLVVSSILNQKFKGRTIARMIFFIPVIVSSGVIAYVLNNWVSIMTVSDIGDALAGSKEAGLNVILSQIDIGQGLIKLIIEAANGLNKVIRSAGMQIYIMLAALQEIPESLYEAAKVEGCSAWECFWKITVPSVVPQIIICGVYTLIDMFTATDTEIYKYISDFEFVNNEFSFASAMNVLYLLTAGICILIGAGVIKVGRGRK